MARAWSRSAASPTTRDQPLCLRHRAAADRLLRALARPGARARPAGARRCVAGDRQEEPGQGPAVARHAAVSLVEYIRRKKLYDPIAHALASTLNYEKSYFDKLVASLLPLLEKLTTGRTASLLSPDIDAGWATGARCSTGCTVINLGGIVYVGLDALSDYEVAGAVGNSMFADLTSVAGQPLQARRRTAACRARGRQAAHRDPRRRVQRADRRRVHPAAEQGGRRRVPGDGLHPDLVGRGGAHRLPRQGRADRRQLQHPDHAAGEGGRDRRAADRASCPRCRWSHHRVVVGVRHQRPGRFHRLCQPQRGPDQRPAPDAAVAMLEPARPGATCPRARPSR
jgi:hypothetical protein